MILPKLKRQQVIGSLRAMTFVTGALLLTSPSLLADTVSVNLGLSNENYTMTGQGSNGTFGTFLDEQGACAASGGTTTCSLSGSYTGSTPGFTGGTYYLITTYDSSTPLRATEFGTNSFGFSATDIGAGTTMSLDLLDSISGAHLEAIYDSGSFVGGFFITFASSTCTGTPVGLCNLDNVGQTPGAVLSGPITGSASFDVPGVAPVPEPGLLAFGGVPALLAMVRRRFPRP